MKLRTPLLLGTILLISTEILAIPILQNPEDKEILSNPDADKTPILIDSAITGKITKLYYPWNAIKILPHPENGIPKIAVTASPKAVLVTTSVSLDVHWQQLREAIDDFTKRHPDGQPVHLVPIHPKTGEYMFALRRLSDGKRHYFPNSQVTNVIPSNPVVITLGLTGKKANEFMEALQKGAIIEIHYQYQFHALTDSEHTSVPIPVHCKLELNGYCEPFPKLFQYSFQTGQVKQGCLPGMTVTDIPETFNRKQICEILPEICQPAHAITQSTNSVDEELAEYCQIFPEDEKCKP